MNQIVFPVLLVSGIGLLSGLILSLASVVMAEPKDKITEKIKNVLPGANCGACGYSGCEGYAKALSKGEAKVGLCSPGGKKVSEAISNILGTDSLDNENKVAIVKCSGTKDVTKDKMVYQGVKSCSVAYQLYGGSGSCSYGCIGFGDCKTACKYGAIAICNGVAIIDPLKCKGCSICVSACPKGLIELVPLKRQAVVKCSNCDKGGKTIKVCDIGCIGCMRCVKACEFGAITVEDSLARVNPGKCTGCGKCVEVCKRGCIRNF